MYQSPDSPRLLLARQLQVFAGLSEDDLHLAEDQWKLRGIPRHEFFNFRNSVCQYVGFIVRGLFRVYYVDPATKCGVCPGGHVSYLP